MVMLLSAFSHVTKLFHMFTQFGTTQRLRINKIRC